MFCRRFNKHWKNGCRILERDTFFYQKSFITLVVK